jgi:hypothetical protein
MLRDAQNAGKRPSASPSQRKTKRPRNSGNDRFQTQLEAKVAKMICISLAPARLDRFPRGFTGPVAHPSRSIENLSRPRLLAATPPQLCLLSRFPQKLDGIGSRRVLCRSSRRLRSAFSRATRLPLQRKVAAHRAAATADSSTCWPKPWRCRLFQIRILVRIRRRAATEKA